MSVESELIGILQFLFAYGLIFRPKGLLKSCFLLRQVVLKFLRVVESLLIDKLILASFQLLLAQNLLHLFLIFLQKQLMCYRVGDFVLLDSHCVIELIHVYAHMMSSQLGLGSFLEAAGQTWDIFHSACRRRLHQTGCLSIGRDLSGTITLVDRGQRRRRINTELALLLVRFLVI